MSLEQKLFVIIVFTILVISVCIAIVSGILSDKYKYASIGVIVGMAIFIITCWVALYIAAWKM